MIVIKNIEQSDKNLNRKKLKEYSDVIFKLSVFL